MIEVKNISKSYGNHLAVNDVSFTLKRGEIAGFLGVNGAGKSTTLKILAGALNADKGTVSVFGNSIVNDALQAKQTIGYLPEDNPLYGSMYVKEYLLYVAQMYSLKGTKEAVEQIVEQMGLQGEYHKKIVSLSKGNRQRVGLAQALIHNPRFLILDEPTSGLDPNQRMEIREILAGFAQSKVVLFSSHILQEVTSICSRYIIIDGGRIVFDDTALGGTASSIEDTFYKLTKKNV
ncbi:ABC-2 type transport system ATP-binding protein [Dysgonomonas sp. PH5-45]|uniref:ABC transporter ATP-binding protein n=1 Tax=unclassified Dysgonomonas TaxID=2630389 RepID=UPI00247516EE|nr:MULTISPECIES: ATP-binding cassette domain-containing protein [unclassified Dysgonomonas]MDH6355180.1 ABC-2 type transport system ATP-binding protein [Dysgonomonas sp. PH5-45]MDH6388094.1 ABC-2 type transport system ATP-binding protein [Dysgonomonas sp. PH5-37]